MSERIGGQQFEMARERTLGAIMNRRRFLVQSGALTGALMIGSSQMAQAEKATVESLTIDLTTEPSSLDPATTYDADGWSIIHSIYDSLIQYGEQGELEPLLAESFELIDPLTYRVKLRSGITFHNGEPLTSKSIAFSVSRLVDPDVGSQVASNFAVIEKVEEVDELTADLKLSAPAPWLPAQIASWLVLLPPEYAAQADFIDEAVGTGPYQFDNWQRGSSVSLSQYSDYFAQSPKGQPIANTVQYRFVADATTRLADVLSGQVDIVRDISVDQVKALTDGGGIVREVPISGCAFVRIPTDVEPFSDVRVRQAMNYAVDVDSIIAALLGGNGQHLASLFVPNGLGYDPDLAPYTYDPDEAKKLLSDAGYPDGFETTLDYTVTERRDPIEALAAQLGDVGIQVIARPQELAVFNSPDWFLGTDPDAAPLRFLTWRPLFDPSTLLSLMFSSDGFISRHDNPDIQPLIDEFAVTTDPAERAQVGIQMGQAFHDEPAAIYLWNLTSIFGETSTTPSWTTRADDYLLATYRDE